VNLITISKRYNSHRSFSQSTPFIHRAVGEHSFIRSRFGDKYSGVDPSAKAEYYVLLPIQYLQLSISHTSKVTFVAYISPQVLATHERLYIEVKDEPALYVLLGVKSGWYSGMITPAYFVEIAAEMSLAKQLAQREGSRENFARNIFQWDANDDTEIL
jgi:hypothetical protein